jgi:hypothetical protein
MVDWNHPLFDSMNVKSQDNKREYILNKERLLGIKKEVTGKLKSTEKQKGNREK